MRYADNLKCDFVLILGDDEIEKGIITLRNMSAKTQQELPLDPQKVIMEIKRQVIGDGS